jgi:hypothetical protein
MFDAVKSKSNGHRESDRPGCRPAYPVADTRGSTDRSKWLVQKITAPVLSVTSITFDSFAASYCKLKQAAAAYCRNSPEKKSFSSSSSSSIRLRFFPLSFHTFVLKECFLPNEPILPDTQLLIYQWQTKIPEPLRTEKRTHYEPIFRASKPITNPL